MTCPYSLDDVAAAEVQAPVPLPLDIVVGGGSKMSATLHHYQGRQCLDIHHLKPAAVKISAHTVWAKIVTAATPGSQQVVVASGPSQGPPGECQRVNYA